MVKQFIIFVLGSGVGDLEARITYRLADYVKVGIEERTRTKRGAF